MTINITFFGDFAPCRKFEALTLDKNEGIFGDLNDNIADADVSFLNLESPLCINGTPIKKSGPNLRTNPDCIHAIAKAGFNAIGLANNHIFDFGIDGLTETLDVCHKFGLPTCGAGKTLEKAQKPLIVDKKGLKIGIIAVAEHEFSIAGKNKGGAAPLDPIDNSLLIEKTRNVVDFLFITIHGGNEYFQYPRPGLRKICKFFIDRGVDGVICHHAHVPGVYEIYKKRPIAYSLGNLIFDHPNPPEGWNMGYALKLSYDLKKKTLFSWDLIPYSQSVKQGGVKKMEARAKKVFLEMLDNYSKILTNEIEYQKIWNTFCETRKSDLLLDMFFPIKIRGLRHMDKFFRIEKMMMHNSTLRARKNLITCESHLELLQTILKDKCS